MSEQTPAGESQIPLYKKLAKLLNDMSHLYGLSFSDNQSKILIASILGGAHAHWINHYLVKVIYRNMPWRSAGMLLRPAVSGSVVYYIGKLFLIHLETGVWRNKTHK